MRERADDIRLTNRAEIGEEWNNLQPDEMPHYESD